MKIAFCISGQLRTWRKCSKSVKKLIQYLNYDVDIFCHTWDFDSSPSLVKKNYIKLHPQDTIMDMVSIYSPIKYCVESQEKNLKVINDAIEMGYVFNGKKPLAAWSSPQYYSISEAARLKTEYELQNNFKYDVCIRLRYDQFIPEIQMSYIKEIINQVKDNTIYTVHNRNISNYPEVVYGDIFWISNSTTYDRVALFYKNIPYIDYNLFVESSPPENVLTHYINSLGIENQRTYLDLKVCRFKEFIDEGTSIGHHEILYEDISENNLWVFGCSFVRGDGTLENDQYGKQFKLNIDDLPWPQLVASQFGFTLKNIGQSGISNETILDNIMRNWDNINEGDYVIIGKTWSHRFDFPKHNGSLDLNSIVYRGDEGDVKKWFDNLTKGIYNNAQIECIKTFSTEFATQPAYSKRHDFRFNFIKKILLNEKKVKICHIWDVEALWNKFELIVNATNGKINDFHWSYKGHKDFASYLNQFL